MPFSELTLEHYLPVGVDDGNLAPDHIIQIFDAIGDEWENGTLTSEEASILEQEVRQRYITLPTEISSKVQVNTEEDLIINLVDAIGSAWQDGSITSDEALVMEKVLRNRRHSA